MIRHILLIQFKPGATCEQLAQLKHEFVTMPDKIQGVTQVEWGENNSPEHKNQGFTHCVMMTFADEDARAEYLPHPEHQQLKVLFSPLIEEIIVFDYAL